MSERERSRVSDRLRDAWSAYRNLGGPHKSAEDWNSAIKWREMYKHWIDMYSYDLDVDYWRRNGPPEQLQKYQYRKAFIATRNILRRMAYAGRAGPMERENMKMENVARPIVDNDEIGINKLLQQSYGIFQDVVNGKVTPQVASAAARNCGNVLKGLELRAKFGVEALRF